MNATRYWYIPMAQVGPTDDLATAKRVDELFGFMEEPPYELVERYDFRLLKKGTLAEITGANKQGSVAK